jgi:hypothetical protein
MGLGRVSKILTCLIHIFPGEAEQSSIISCISCVLVEVYLVPCYSRFYALFWVILLFKMASICKAEVLSSVLKYTKYVFMEKVLEKFHLGRSLQYFDFCINKPTILKYL